MPLRLIFLHAYHELFFYTDTATTQNYTLSLHDALPILARARVDRHRAGLRTPTCELGTRDRKSTRLNYSHLGISYAVFCLKKKNSWNIIYQKHQMIMQLIFFHC